MFGGPWVDFGRCRPSVVYPWCTRGKAQGCAAQIGFQGAWGAASPLIFSRYMHTAEPTKALSTPGQGFETPKGA